MNLLSVTYNLTADDFKKISKALPKPKRKLTLKKLVLIAVILIYSGFCVWIDLTFFAANFLQSLIIPFVLINIIAVYNHKKAEYKLLKRSVTIELFEDRIEIIRNQTEDFKGKYKKVFSFEKVADIQEFSEFLILKFNNSDTEFLMKKHFKKEELEQIMLKLKK